MGWDGVNGWVGGSVGDFSFLLGRGKGVVCVELWPIISLARSLSRSLTLLEMTLTFSFSLCCCSVGDGMEWNGIACRGQRGPTSMLGFH
jgi:hypothetical protein